MALASAQSKTPGASAKPAYEDCALMRKSHRTFRPPFCCLPSRGTRIQTGSFGSVQGSRANRRAVGHCWTSRGFIKRADDVHSRSGGTMNIMKSPPPGPDNLPASAPSSKAIWLTSSIKSLDTPAAVLFCGPRSVENARHLRDVGAKQRLLHLDGVRLQPVQTIEDLRGF